MVKFVAKKPVDMTALEDSESLPDSNDASFEDLESDGFVVELGDFRAEVEGSGFAYLAGKPLPVGTITQIEVFEFGDLAYKLTDLSTKMSELASASHVQEIVLDTLVGDDKLKGSSGDDTLAGGNGSDQLFGKGGDDTLYGQEGKDLLDGGLDSDTLDGGSGKDTYLFRDAPGDGIDKIVEFESGETIKVEAKSFAGLSKGALSSDQFVQGTEAGDGDDRFIYDPDTGALYHDADGAGAAAQTQFAQLQINLSNFHAGNIIVV